MDQTKNTVKGRVLTNYGDEQVKSVVPPPVGFFDNIAVRRISASDADVDYLPQAGAATDLDLQRLEHRLKVEDGVTEPRQRIAEYTKWLREIVASWKEGKGRAEVVMVPILTLDLDKVWQRHQLDTRAYMEDCRKLFGDGDLSKQALHKRGCDIMHYIHRLAGTRMESGMVLGIATVDSLGVPMLGKVELKGRPPVRVDEVVCPAQVVSALLPIKQLWCAKSAPLAKISLTNIQDTAREYARWLEILTTDGSKTKFSPSKLVDELWHAHILDSKAYARFCHEHYGVYVHHEPSYEESHAFHKPAFKACLLAYKKHFGHDPPTSHWGIMGESGGGTNDGPDPLHILPPSLPPPELVDPTTGVAWLPFTVKEINHYDCYCRPMMGCCWSPTGFDPFVPVEGSKDYRKTARVPEPLIELGVDQQEYSAMLEDVKIGLGIANPEKPCCCVAICCCFCYEFCWRLDPIVKVEESIAPRAGKWRAMYGVQTAVVRDLKWNEPIRDLKWNEPIIPTEKWQPFKPHSEWEGHALTFILPDAPEVPTMRRTQYPNNSGGVLIKWEENPANGELSASIIKVNGTTSGSQVYPTAVSVMPCAQEVESMKR